MKEEICKVLKTNPNEIIMRRGGRASAELKEVKKTISGANLTSGSSIFLEFGKPALDGEIRICLSYSIPSDP